MRDIREGRYLPGAKLPSEAALAKQFKTSRITVGRALRELKQRGLVKGVAGAGTFVREAESENQEMLFGLLIPDLGETEIFGPICNGLATSAGSQAHALIWGQRGAGTVSPSQQALDLCRQFIQRRVSGVFFAPIEFVPENDGVNREIAAMLETARIPVVLLDRCILPFPQRSRHDLVGIDNRRAGYLATAHLLERGVKRIGFVAFSGTAPTIQARIAGYREALLDAAIPLDAALVQRLDTIDAAAVESVLAATKARAFVCANDRTAGQFMHGLLDLGLRVPEDVRIVGIDDVEYARMLPVPLTTVRQPCREIGEAAMSTMLDRLRNPLMATRDVYVECELVVRRSS